MQLKKFKKTDQNYNELKNQRMAWRVAKLMFNLRIYEINLSKILQEFFILVRINLPLFSTVVPSSIFMFLHLSVEFISPSYMLAEGHMHNLIANHWNSKYVVLSGFRVFTPKSGSSSVPISVLKQ